MRFETRQSTRGEISLKTAAKLCNGIRSSLKPLFHKWTTTNLNTYPLTAVKSTLKIDWNKPRPEERNKHSLFIEAMSKLNKN